MKKSFIFLACILLAGPSLLAQKDGQITLFPWASLNYNPGAAGEQNNTLCFTVFFRQQYLGIKEPAQSSSDGKTSYNDVSIRDMNVNIEFYSRKIRGAFALSIKNDKAAYFNNIDLKLGYAYKLNLGPGKLGIGLQLGMINQSLDFTKLKPNEEGDPLLLGKDESYLNMDFHFGLHYKTERWYAGVSALQLLGNKAIGISGEDNVKPVRTFYAMGGYIWTLPWNPSWNIEPSAIIRTDFGTMNFDLMAIARYNGILWGGVSYRLQDAVSIVLGAQPFYNSNNNYLKGLEMGLAYSFTTNKLGYITRGSSGDIEFVIRYCFDIYRQEVFSGYGSSRSIYKNQY
ncbi:PorP/SprF family type IX secretion system membrane protein [Bacteroidales bacterium OttesenSCG-928-B11]|nr:PorP/SprF family type IX secretion system membrane protein [Bacteroidales bacterium OttesenSCG-928-B11]MDL2325898.1 PorP/SprF family type IX secretion system membrane protein [Bacteroidales bacterium OttesenSCG-928-A14]